VAEADGYGQDFGSTLNRSRGLSLVKERMARSHSPRAVSRRRWLCCQVFILLALLPVGWVHGATVFRIATYNLENYLDQPLGNRLAKPKVGRDQICTALQLAQPDVLAVQEIGGAPSLAELQSRLKTANLHLPHTEIVQGYDTNIQVALLSRFPITARRSHSKEYFLVRGRRYRTTRGILDVEITLPSSYRFTLLGVHLKSRRETGGVSQQDVRKEEARVLRRIVDHHLRAQPEANLVVLGDFNDDPRSLAVRTVIGRGRTALLDTRPAEKNGDRPVTERSGTAPRNIAWTHFYGREDLYSRVDYVLLSGGMAREWQPQDTWVLSFPNWGIASDHRPLVATFVTVDR